MMTKYRFREDWKMFLKSQSAISVLILLFLTLIPLAIAHVAAATIPPGWSGQDCGTARALYSTAGVDANTAWAVGDVGTIIKTTDHGNHWTAQNSGTDRSLTGVSAVDTNTAWAVGFRVILKTSDGGATWINQSSETEDIYSVSAVDSNTAWAVGWNTILRTTDGGVTWSNQDFPPEIPNIGLSDICAVSSSTAWASGDTLGGSSCIINTTNGGTTWTLQRIEEQGRYINSIDAVNSSVAWAVGNEGRILKTTNGGALWSNQTSGTAESLYGVGVADQDKVWAVGTNGIIVETDNGGVTWQTQESGTPEDLRFVSAADTNIAWAVGSTLQGNRGLVLSTAPLPPPEIVSISTSGPVGSTITINGNNFGSVQGPCFVSFGSTHATQCSSWTYTEIKCQVPNGVIGEVQVAVTTRSGTSNSLSFTAISIASISPNSGTVGTTVAINDLNGAGFKTGAAVSLHKGTAVINATDVVVHSSTKISCNISLTHAALGSYDVWVQNSGGVEAKLVGGFTVTVGSQSGWYSQWSGTTLNRVSAVDASTAWAVGGQTILKTIDGGVTWSPQVGVPPQEWLVTVSAVDANTAYAVGGSSEVGGTIIKTTDGGATWVKQNSGTIYNLTAVSAVDANTAWAVGGDSATGFGVILKTSNGGATWVAQVITHGDVFCSISAVDANYAMAGGLLGVWVTSNGGANWVLSYGPGGQSIFWAGVAAVDYNNAWAVCNNGIFKYTNGVWAKQDCGGVMELRAVSAWNADSAWAVSGNKAFKTANGGATWVQQTEGISGTLTGVAAASGGSAWAVGSNGIFHTLPVVTSITPSSGTQNTTVNVTNLAGLGFQSGATVQLQQGSTVVNATSVVVASATKITCSFGIGAPPVGSYDVVVKNPDGQEGRLKNGFTVNADPGQCGAGGGLSMGLMGAMMGLLSLAGAGSVRSRSRRRSA